MKKIIIPVLMMLCLFSSVAYAENNTGSEKTGTLTLTEENRYNPVYYQEPEECYPAASGRSARAAELSLEEYVVNALENFQTEINVSAYEIPEEEASTRYFQILNNHLELFYVESYVSWSFSPMNNKVIKYSVRFTDTEENIKAQRVVFKREIAKALAWVDSSMTDLEKALAIHDYLVLDCEYDYENLLNNTVTDISHSAYGALINKMAVCDGYSKAYSCLLNELGISSTIVSSDSMNHAWNQIFIDGKWYHVDVTWDDPVWDCIGRVGHNYFLLSDAAISDENHEHTGWDGGYTADSTVNDDVFWSGVTSAFCYQNGSWYYAKYLDDRKTSLMKKQGHLLEASEEVIYTEEETWNYYIAGYMYLDIEPIKNEIYFNTRTEIKKIEESGTFVTVYEPELSQNQLIFGFTVRGAQMCYALQEAPGNGKQVVSTYTVEELRLLPMTGITAKDVEAVYDGTAKQINVEGVQEGDIVTYKHTDGTYGPGQPEMINAGIYQVSYKVEREGYEPYIGEAKVTITAGCPGHKYSEKIIIAPTATQKGKASYTCEICGDTYTKELDVLKQDKVNAQKPEKVSGLKLDKATANSLQISWKKVNGAKYRLVIYQGNTAVSTIYTDKNTYTCTKLKAATLYTVKVTSYVESNGTKIYASSDTFIKATTSPAKVKLVSVKKNGGTKAKITWKKVTDADGYEISMRTGKGSYKVIKNITKGKTVVFTKSGLKKGKSYSFRIRAYKKSGSSKSYGSYSNVKTIKIK